MKVLFLSNNLDITMPLLEWLQKVEGIKNVRHWDKPLNTMVLDTTVFGMEFIVSYNYDYIIKKDVISRFPEKIVNLHISLLPWNRGGSPNLWSFIDETPKGVTIHLVDEGIDTGPILFQHQVHFDESIETLASSYMKLHNSIQSLFREKWSDIKQGKVKSYLHSTYHTQEETESLIREYTIQWNENILAVKNRISLGVTRSE